jgi:hypothetical protein
MNASGSGSMSAILQFGIGADHPPGLHLGGHPPSVGHSMSITHRSALTTLRDRSVSKCSDAEPGRDGRALTQYPRALARHQVGMPLARWRVWARLRPGG